MLFPTFFPSGDGKLHLLAYVLVPEGAIDIETKVCELMGPYHKDKQDRMTLVGPFSLLRVP